MQQLISDNIHSFVTLLADMNNNYLFVPDNADYMYCFYTWSIHMELSM
jgi:hypothetical protein